MQRPEPAGGGGMLAEYFKFAERGTNLLTEARGGLTTFMVMVYIVFLNASILGDGFKLAADDPGRIALSAGTALIAGIMTIAMGAWANYPLALAAGLGINAIVAFSLTGRGLTPAGAMGVIVLEGLAVTVLVLVGFREAVMNAVPLASACSSCSSALPTAASSSRAARRSCRCRSAPGPS
jgi:AGZA family xanthine/uracil permease-like MFS transporter